MYIYTQLFITMMLQVALTVVMYVLQKKTAFNKLPYYVQQGIIGVVFGLAAIFGTEYGVDIGGATVNARDAAAMCAGLIFGSPAGIIAGVIGGVERWFAVLWGAGVYSRVACSVSTVIAGVYAALLRKYMFDDKCPTFGVGFAIGVVMEIMHLSLLFLTHLSDSEKAYEIVKISTIPMMLFNGLSLMLSILAISFFSKRVKSGEKQIRNISQKVQTWMLICVVLAYLATTLFVYMLQTNTAIVEINTLLSLNLNDVKRDIEAAADSNLLSVTRLIKEELDNGYDGTLEQLAQEYNVSEINIVNGQGVITESTNEMYINFDMKSGEQSEQFMVLCSGTQEFVQDFMPTTADRNVSCKYAGCVLNKGGFVQVGYNREMFKKDFSEQVLDIGYNRHVGENGYILIADSDGDIINGEGNLEDRGFDDISTYAAEKRNDSDISGVTSFWMYTNAEKYTVIAVISYDEAFKTRDAAVYVNSYMEVLVFALLYALIYFLIKGLVVNNIRSVNSKLEQIIGGDLSVTVDVRSSSEFASLSDDINSTVSTLKCYIAEASARIDKELEFARNIQHSALPSVFPAYPNIEQFDIYATMDTAKEVGGDFYDFYMIGEHNLVLLMADVSGKGIPAAMFMMRAKTLIKNLAEAGMDASEILESANGKLCEGNDAQMFVTAWMGILNIKTGKIIYANAGHNPPVLCRKNGECEYLRSKPSLVLAAMEGIKYKPYELTLNPGDRLYLYTDGVTEANNEQCELYGEQRLLQLIKTQTESSVQQALCAIKEDIDCFAGKAEQFDDITMLAVDYYGGGVPVITEKRSFAAADWALAEANEFLNDMLKQSECSVKVASQLSVVLEEIFINIANYAYPGASGDAEIEISVGNAVTLKFTDTGVPFNPLKKDDPDITLSAEKRDIGGLGIFMVKKIMDTAEYEYTDGKNIFTVSKNL